MKRHKNLYPKICSFANLLLAFKKARKNKRTSPDVLRFQQELESNLINLQQALQQGTYQPGAYRSFTIYEPKERLISAAPFRDRVVHHALCNIIEPLLDKTLIFDTYANRHGKGVHAAIRRAQYYLRQYPYYLKTDIQKYFPSIDHQLLKQAIRRKIGCKDTLMLIEKIIDNSNEQEPVLNLFPGDDLFTATQRRRGLPIGNLTSQIFANYFLNELDHLIKETLQIPGYVRYMDDLVLFHHDRAALQHVQKAIAAKLASLRLVLHSNKTFIRPSAKGLVFCGQQIFVTHRKLRSENVRRFKKRITAKTKQYLAGRFTEQKMECSLNGWRGHALQANTFKLQKSIFALLRSKGLPLVVYPRGSWGLLEQ